MRRPAEAFHPSEYIRDELMERGWSTAELAERMGVEERSVLALLHGHAVDERIARALSRAFGTSWEIWLGLQIVWDGGLMCALGLVQQEAAVGEQLQATEETG